MLAAYTSVRGDARRGEPDTRDSGIARRFAGFVARTPVATARRHAPRLWFLAQAVSRLRAGLRALASARSASVRRRGRGRQDALTVLRGGRGRPERRGPAARVDQSRRAD